MRRLGQRTLEFERPTILSHGAVGGKREAEGPLGGDFDQTFGDTTLQEGSWEKAEARLQKEAVTLALEKAGLSPREVDFILAGDLLNQCISSTFGLLDFGIPFLGQYVESGAAEKALAVTSSHFCSAERQFRLPLEYGGQRAPTAQWTATAAGCALVGLGGKVRVARGLAGTIQDLGVKDPANMGAAMAPAAAASLYQFLQDTGTSPGDYDGIFTGDLGAVGSQLLYQCLEDNHVDVRSVHQDCGLLLYDRQRQDVILFCATGALMSPTSSQQGQAIPGVCHVVQLLAP